jgi:hypothetical protein
MINMLAKIKTQIAAALSSLIGLIIFGTIVYHYLEGWTWIQSFYFSVVSLTTVGYGDLHPTNDMSRLFTAFYMLIGVAIVLTSLAVIGKNYLEKREGKISRRKDKFVRKSK